MTYQQLIYFSYSAKTLSFSKAASLCYVAQTAVSKQIQNLEDELGCQLFLRNGRQLELTAAGDNLKLYADQIIKIWNDSIESTKNIGGTTFKKSSIIVGYWGCIESGNLTYIFNDFLKSEPNCSIFYTHLSLDGIINCLRNETVDLIIAPEDHIKAFEEIHYRTLLSCPFGIIINKNNPLCKNERIYPKDLKKETFIQRGVSDSIGLKNARKKCWDSLGYYPEHCIKVNEYKSAVMMVSNNMGISLSPEYVEEIEGKDIEFRMIEGFSEVENLALGYVDSNDKTVIKRFLSYLNTLI